MAKYYFSKLMRENKASLINKAIDLGTVRMPEDLDKMSKADLADYIMWLQDEDRALSAEEQTLVDEYMDKTDAVVSRFCGSWVISDYSDSIKYATKAELMEAVRYNLHEMYEDIARQNDEVDNIFFYEYTEEDLGCNERVIADYYPDFGVVSVSAIEENENGLWYYYADIEADMFSVCDKTRFMQLLLDNSDKGCSCGTYNTLGEILEEDGKSNPMLYLFRPASWAYQLKQMEARC